MESTWYCRTGEGEFGPLDWDQLQQLATRGWLQANSPVREGLGAWVLASQVSGLIPARAVSAPVARLVPRTVPPPTAVASPPIAVAAAVTRALDVPEAVGMEMVTVATSAGNAKGISLNPRAYQQARQRRNLWITAGMCVAILIVGGIAATIQITRSRSQAARLSRDDARADSADSDADRVTESRTPSVAKTTVATRGASRDEPQPVRTIERPPSVADINRQLSRLIKEDVRASEAARRERQDALPKEMEQE